MSDGIKGAAQLIGEAVIKPVVDEVGKAIEEGVQTATGLKTAPAPKQNNQNQNLTDPQKLQQDDARKKKNIMQFLQSYKQQEQLQRQKTEQLNQQKQQEEVQETQEIKQYEFAKKQDSVQRQAELQRAKSRSERKGAGGG